MCALTESVEVGRERIANLVVEVGDLVYMSGHTKKANMRQVSKAMNLSCAVIYHEIDETSILIGGVATRTTRKSSPRTF